MLAIMNFYIVYKSKYSGESRLHEEFSLRKKTTINIGKKYGKIKNMDQIKL